MKIPTAIPNKNAVEYTKESPFSDENKLPHNSSLSLNNIPEIKIINLILKLIISENEI